MSSYAITPSKVIPDTKTGRTGIAGEAINAGDLVYADETDSDKIKKAQATTEAKCECLGMAVCNAVAGQPVTYVTSGDLTISDTGTFTNNGQPLHVDYSTAGEFEDAGSETVGQWMTRVGYSLSADRIRIALEIIGIQFTTAT